MFRKLFFILLLSVGFLGATYSTAGVILVSGDSNTTDDLGTAGDEDTFFTNILGGGTSVAVLDFTNGGFGSASNTDTEINNYYNSLGGVSSSLIAGSVTAASLSGVDLFVAATPDDNFSASEILAMSNFLSSNGTIFFLGENNNAVFTTANNAINQALGGRGSSISLISGALSGSG